MTVSTCPSCREPVTVPSGAPGSARVRCPLCRDEFLLSVVLEKLPPALELLDQPAAEAPADSLGGFSIGPVVSTKSPAFEFDEASAPSARRGVSPSPRPKRKEKNVAIEMVKIVLGGVVGIGLATLILWWGFHRDPLNLAPTVGTYASWAVPAKLRPPAKEPATDDTGADRPDPRPSSSSGAKTGNTGSVAASANFPGGGEGKKPALQGEILGDPPFAVSPPKQPDDPLNIGGLPGIGAEPRGPKAADTKPKETKPKAPAPPSETSVPPAVSAPSGTPSKPKRFDLAKTLKPRTALDLAQAVAEARLAADDVAAALTPAVNELSPEKRREFGERYHSTISRLGEVVISVDPNDPQVQNEMRNVAELFHEIAQAPERQKLLALLTERGLNATERAHQGLCVPGVVAEISPAGKLYEIRLELLTKDKTPVLVYASDDPSKFYQTGARVMLLGAIVPDPKKNLTGYTSDEAEARCVHFFVPLLAEKPATEKPPETGKTPPAAGAESSVSPATSEKPAPAKAAPAPAKPSDEEAK